MLYVVRVDTGGDVSSVCTLVYLSCAFFVSCAIGWKESLLPHPIKKKKKDLPDLPRASALLVTPVHFSD